jgi:LPXTG-site transpeptidase (sortase) family protein
LIGIAKEVKSVEKISAGTHDITMSLLILNYGNVTLHNIKITDDLTDAFPLPTTFSVKSVTSSDLTVNPNFNGDGDINLLLDGNTLDVGQSKVIELVVTVIPTSYGPYTNTARVYGTSPEDVEVSDLSQVGVDPDPDKDHDPTDNNENTPVKFDAHMFDPPYGIKTLDDSGQPVLKWTMVWINDTNIVDINATVHDPIPEETFFTPDLLDSGYGVPVGAPDDSTSLGVSCTSSTGTTTTLCYYEGPTTAHPRGQIIWKGVLGPDLGVTDPKDAKNAISITFGVTVLSTTVVRNEATIDSDINGDGDATDSGERFLVKASYVWDVTPGPLPDTGFAPDQISLLPKTKVAYDPLDDLWLEIPSLQVKTPILGVPVDGEGWDVSWLGTKAGWLTGTAYPTTAGNSVITGHVYLPNGTPGPFVDLGTLHWGDKVIIHYPGKEYVYEVREVNQVLPGNRTVFSHEERSWITLVTCQGYNEKTGEYAWRKIVKAVLISVTDE